MALNDVTFVKGQGGLGRPLAGEDHISGMVFYVNEEEDLPSGFGEFGLVKTIFSLEEAEALGIVDGKSGNEQPDNAAITLTETAEADDTVEILVNGVSIGSIVVDSTALDDIAQDLRTAINEGTETHGFETVDEEGPVIHLIAPALAGARYNGGVTVDVESEELEVTITTQFLNGKTDSTIVPWYHIKEYFRIQPKGVLYVGFFEKPDLVATPPATDYNFAEVTTLQALSGGVIRQVAVFIDENLDTTNLSQVSVLHGIANNLSATHKPLSILLAANIKGVALSSLPDMSASVSTGSYVSVIIGQDGNGIGKSIYDYTGKSVTTLGAALGAVSRAKVSENIGWVKTFNLAENELDEVAFANGTVYRDVATSQLSTLNDRHYIFIRKHIGVSGTFFNDSHTAVSETSDYSTIENNRTIDKAIRNIRTFLIPELNGPLFVNPDGSLAEDTVAYFQNLASRPLEQMQRDEELSAFQVIINPEQNVLASSTLTVIVKLIPVGVARQIVVNIGFTVNIS